MKKSRLFMPLPFIALAVFLIWGMTACKRETPPTAEAPPPAPAPEPHVIAQIHFAGTASISSNINSAAFTNEFCSPEAQALESQTLDKLSHAPGIWFKNKISAGASDGSAQLRPLLDDFLKSEWVFEMRDAPASPEYALAIRLESNRAGIWQTNLRSLLESWTKIPATNIANGWELKKNLPPNLIRFVRSGDWVVVGCGQEQLPLMDAWTQGKIPETGTNWLSTDMDWPRLTQIFPILAKFDFPAFTMQVTGQNSNLCLVGKFSLSQPLSSLEKWQTPTNIIHRPLLSFTAARGFGAWLGHQSWAKQFQLSPPLNQVFVWSLGLMPLETFIAAPVPNATNALAQLGQNLSANTNWQSEMMSPFEFNKTTKRIFLKDVPFIAPEVLALNEPTGDILFADVFPNLPRGTTPPPGLILALDRTNLVFYHWEDTSARLKMLPQLTQLALLLTRHRQLNANSAASKWLGRIGPSLGRSQTEVIQTGPSELTLTRNASAGLTAVELVALANWLEAPDFPGCHLQLPHPPPQLMQFHKPIKKLSAPGTLPAPSK
jgi:hypothetical protein